MRRHLERSRQEDVARPQHALEAFPSERPREQIALAEVAAGQLQLCQLVGRFDAFAARRDGASWRAR